ncbi:MAG: hypothetical protein JHC82_12845, partial [Stenotrophomonas sp.]|nr:hypothetical protein [Stenotrophomonas sp.]
AELPVIHEEDDEDPIHASELFGTTPPREPVTRRKVRFDHFGTSRVNEVDAESGETLSISDQRFQTKEHDGKWSARSAHLQSSLNPFDPQPEEPWSPASMAVPHAPVAGDDSGFVVQSAFHEDQHDQATHAQMSGTFWFDLVRENELAAMPVGETYLQLQRIQQMQREVEQMQREVEALRRNQQLNEDIGVYF